MFINIITPCSRVENLWKLYESINFPNYRWIVVFDGLKVDGIPETLPPTVEPYIVADETGISGNPQRNHALELVEDGWVYFLDDDNLIHPELYSTVEPLSHAYDFIHFKQSESYNPHEVGELQYDIRIRGDVVKLGWIDTHQYITRVELIGDTRWVNDLYEADGVFAEQVYGKATNPLWVDKFLSVYNELN
jgi:hypothetical protein